MSIPTDHHYLPKFYLHAWAVDGKLVEFSRPYREVVSTSRTPKGTGFQPSLYSLPGEDDPHRREQIELGIMNHIDGRGAVAYQKLMAGRPQDLEADQRSAWALFVNSLLFRTPARLRWFDEQLRGAEFAFTEDESADDEPLRSTEQPSDAQGFFKDASDDDLSVARMSLMIDLIASQQLGQGIFGMVWEVLPLPSLKHGLLTSDDPIMMSNGMDRPDSFLLLPLGPHHLFVAGSTERAVQAFTSQLPRDLERAINTSIAEQAEQIVIGHHNGHQRFVEARLGKTPRGPGVLGRTTWQCP